MDWISVKDSLPEVGGTYLAAIGGNVPFPVAVYLVYFVRFEDGPVWSIDGHFRTAQPLAVTHWMPLPEPPKV